jgi:hypothetical protein
MTEQNKIPGRDDVEALAREMKNLKETLRDVSGKLGRIEKRLRVFFSTVFPHSKPRARAERLENSPASMTPDQVLNVYNDLINLARSDRPTQVEDKLNSLTLGDLALLVKELGAPMGSKPTRTLLVKSVLGRLKQSIMLSRHTPRPSTPFTSSSEATAIGETGNSSVEESETDSKDKS